MFLGFVLVRTLWAPVNECLGSPKLLCKTFYVLFENLTFVQDKIFFLKDKVRMRSQPLENIGFSKKKP